MSSYSERYLDPDQARRYPDKFQRSWLRRASNRWEHGLVRRAVRRARICLGGNPMPRLLDFPCGTGRFAPLLASLAGSYLAADHSGEMLKLCRSQLARAGFMERSAGFVEGDARNMPLMDDSVDLACCIRLLHHFKDPGERRAIVREFRRVSTGPLVLSFLDGESMKQWTHARAAELAGEENRRAVLSRAELSREAEDVGYRLLRTWSVSGLFSGQTIALLDPW
ncbi:MAG: class I SAM-dependent methyltransferase [Planctomycetota bacterium]